MTHNGNVKSPCGRKVLSDSEWEAIGEALELSSDYLALVHGIFDDVKKEQIAADLRLSVHAVDMRFRHSYMHLKVRSRPQVIVKVIATHKALTGGGK